MNVRFQSLASLLALYALTSCQTGASTQQREGERLAADSADFAHAVDFSYAQTIRVDNQSGHKDVFVLDPDSGDTLAVYTLYPRGGEAPTKPHPRAIMIAVPVERLGCLSTPQVGALPILGLEHRLVAAADLNLITAPEVRSRIDSGLVTQVAQGMSQNVEAIISSGVEVLLRDYIAGDDQARLLERAGVASVLFNSWRERTLLGRAEWLKLTGMLLGANLRADSTFHQIEASYQQARALTHNAHSTIPIMYGTEYQGAWYIPGEYSYPTAMMRDAGISYEYTPGASTSTPVSFEHVFSRNRHAKVWLASSVGEVRTRQAFLALNERYKHFEAAKSGQIFLDNKRLNASGGNDYWESGPYRPDLVLRDLIKMTRPELLPDYELTYFTELP